MVHDGDRGLQAQGPADLTKTEPDLKVVGIPCRARAVHEREAKPAKCDRVESRTISGQNNTRYTFARGRDRRLLGGVTLRLARRTAPFSGGDDERRCGSCDSVDLAGNKTKRSAKLPARCRSNNFDELCRQPAPASTAIPLHRHAYWWRGIIPPRIALARWRRAPTDGARRRH